MYGYAEPKQARQRDRVPSEKPNLTGIPGRMKNQFEAASGLSFDDVRVHYRSDRPAQLRALAFTQGNQVYIGPGQERHLGHELGHIIQQKRGRVAPTAHDMGYPVNDDPALEREADRLAAGTEAVSGPPSPAVQAQTGASRIIQRQHEHFDDHRIQDRIDPCLDFQKGDLLYGIYEDRLAYAPHLEDIEDAFGDDEDNPNTVSLDYPVIVDYMNSMFLGTEEPVPYGEPLNEIPDLTGSEMYRQFRLDFELLMKSKIDTVDVSWENCEAKIRTSCKFAIWWTVQRGNTIHFILDSTYSEENQHDIAHKENENGTSITAEELRYVKTSWSDFGGNVKFYNGKSTVPAPWVSPFAEQWENSVPERLELDPEDQYIVTPQKANAELNRYLDEARSYEARIAEIDQQLSQPQAQAQDKTLLRVQRIILRLALIQTNLKVNQFCITLHAAIRKLLAFIGAR